MTIKMVTMTGADDSIDPERLVDVSKKYPFVEWGILVSKSSMGGKRFPSYEWIEKLYYLSYKRGMNLSLHLCGQWVRDLLAGESSDLHISLNYGKFLSMFDRIQLNTHAQLHESTGNYVNAIKAIGIKKVIVQFDGVNDVLCAIFARSGIDVYPLFDLSGGAGVVPGEWPAPRGKFSGYAGGLGPDNLEHEVDRIKKASAPCDIWIDMETKVRSRSDEQFDVYKVSKCLDIMADKINI